MRSKPDSYVTISTHVTEKGTGVKPWWEKLGEVQLEDSHLGLPGMKLSKNCLMSWERHTQKTKHLTPCLITNLVIKDWGNWLQKL